MEPYIKELTTHAIESTEVGIVYSVLTKNPGPKNVQKSNFFSFIFQEYLLQILLNNTTRTIPRSARCHDNSVAIDMNNT